MAEAQLPDWERLALDPGLLGDLRSDHAGETGAVFIYRGILAVSRSPRVREFAREHLAVEQVHLSVLDDWIPPAEHSWLLPLWRLSGWLLGAIPASFGEQAVYRTVEAVETFVVRHYQAQIDRLDEAGPEGELRELLCRFRDEEAGHRDDAGGQAAADGGALARLWQGIVAAGSAAAVRLARRV